MRRVILFILLFSLIIVSGCNEEKSAIPKHGASMYDDLSINLKKSTKTIDLFIDSGNLQIYCWDKKVIKLEAKHTIRDNKTNEELEEMLKKYTITSEEKDNTLFFKVEYDGKIKNPQDIYTDIKLTVPKQINTLNISHQYGSIIVRDRFEGDITADLDYVNSEIKAFKGQLIYECDNGNLRVNSGKLSNQSYVDINSGNIYIKAQCQEKSKYFFKTKTGNIDLHFPIDSGIKLNSTGTVNNNQFAENGGDIEIEAISKMGKISLNGY
ncbi:hypothetical protein EHE19_012290 [Ruminiclostridium herbifermentans]|uniref:Adhesin domain-containing protein n=1 Tax=Ruminiclostridium herbifermentans TaxID=2488810 RepID=A0A4U7JE04_9FIRM|nr:hypothetical protein [Ruminiclostridium herbifermentans]QNU65695.1 hypothetical protein EHE19_012290 [Ruminiclostridium herbifermentans]